jgi:hypothetical protein
MRAFILGILIGLPCAVAAQTPACADSTIHFEYQMSTPARWISDTTISVRPTAAVRYPDNLIQFVVDTIGVPQTRTFRALKIADSALVGDARRALASWRYSPGLLNGCRVKQVVQTPVGR